MRLPNSAHTSRPWRIHELTDGFRLEDVWQLPPVDVGELIDGDDFARVVQTFASLDPSQSSSPAVRALFAIRRKLGEVFGWDRPGTGVGSRVATLRDRLPADLRDGPRGPQSGSLPFTSLYLTEDEWAAEVANQTVHGVIHIGRCPDGTGRSRIQMAIYVKPNGVAGNLYVAAIKPFRHLIVYPAILGELERTWRTAQRPASLGAPT